VQPPPRAERESAAADEERGIAPRRGPMSAAAPVVVIDRTIAVSPASRTGKDVKAAASDDKLKRTGRRAGRAMPREKPSGVFSRLHLQWLRKVFRADKTSRS